MLKKDLNETEYSDLVNKITELYEAHISREDMAAQLNVTLYKVNQICQKYKLHHTSGRKKVTYDSGEKHCPGCDQTLSLNEFRLRKKRGKIVPRARCQKCDNKDAIFYRAEKRIGKVYKHELVNYTDDLLNNVKALFDERYTEARISKALGIKPGTVRHALKLLEVDKKNCLPRVRVEIGTERYCKECNMMLPISEFEIHINKKGHNKIRNLCKFHLSKLQCKYAKNYSINNKEKIRKKQLKKHKYKMQKDPVYALNFTIRRQVSKALNKKNIKKTNRTFNLLGYTAEELKNHIENLFEPWMNWKNHGVYSPLLWNDSDSSTWRWHIDHIIPKSEFEIKDEFDENIRKCWALSNLRPYSAKENVFDGARRTRHIK